MLTLNQSQPWLKAPEESPKAYAAFERYLLLGPEARSILAAWKSTVTDRRRIGARKPSRRWELWSVQYAWVSRAAAWDALQHTERRRQFERQAAGDKVERIQYAKVAKGMVALAMQKLDTYLKSDEATVRFSEVFTAMRIVHDELRNEYDDQPTQRHQYTESELDTEIARKLALLDLRRQSLAVETPEADNIDGQ